jgi:carnosine N-methyltransferase
LSACAQKNIDFVSEVLYVAQKSQMLPGDSDAEDEDGQSEGNAGHAGCASELDELYAVLHSLVREWSSEGETERSQIFALLVAELQARLPSPSTLTSGGSADVPISVPRVLCPGSGLGRLPAEFCAAGNYEVEANEMSLQMNIVAGFIMNCTSAEEEDAASFEIHPFIHQNGNHVTTEDQTRAITIPDVSPSTLVGDMPFETVPGDFLAIYSEAEQAGAWDCVTTSWFIDTAPCVLEYIECIYKLLQPGGIWLNYGPLLFHWLVPDADEDGSDPCFARSLDLPWSMVRKAILAKGFAIEKEEWRSTSYTENKRSMMQTEYKCIFFVAVKQACHIMPCLTASQSIKA